MLLPRLIMTVVPDATSVLWRPHAPSGRTKAVKLSWQEWSNAWSTTFSAASLGLKQKSLIKIHAKNLFLF